MTSQSSQISCIRRGSLPAIAGFCRRWAKTLVD
jgi:hypothetical protein